MRSTTCICVGFLVFFFCLASLAQAANAGKKGATQPAKRLAPGGKWTVGDMNRPQPKVIDPGTGSTADQPGRPPSDAIILFDGKDLSQWRRQPTKTDPSEEPKWKVENGYMEVVPKGGMIATKESFAGDIQLHIEWATPAQVQGNSQSRGNSGIMLFGRGELQVLDSFDNPTYADGSAGALYGRFPPLVNASRKPGEWQTYDVICIAPKFDAEKKLIAPGLATVLHNGVLVHHAAEIGTAPEGPLMLQDHNNPVRYRNIWLRKLKGYDEQ
jgi:hypothetical protein